MKLFEHIKKHAKAYKAGAISVCTLLFLGSVALSLFGGGEFVEEVDTNVKGILSYSSIKYDSAYIVGDTFVFDKSESHITLLAKDPTISRLVNISDLPASEYGFMVNGTGNFIIDPSAITMTKDIEYIDVVSKVYRNLSFKLDVTVSDPMQVDNLVTNLTLEAEDARLLSNAGKEITEEEKATMPDTNKPYRSDKGATIDGVDCSGGACLRYISAGMKVEFTFYSDVSTTVGLEVMACKRKTENVFDASYGIKVNGNEVKTNHTTPADAAGGYFQPYTFPSININVVRGINKIVFECLAANPNNLDGIKLTAASQILAVID